MFDRFCGRRERIAPADRDPVRLAERMRRDAPDSDPQADYSHASRRRDFRAVLRETPAGRRVCAQILGRCGVLGRSHVPGDPLETARREGMREIGLWLLDIVAEERQSPPEVAEDEPGFRNRRPSASGME